MCLMKRLYSVSYLGLLTSLQVGELRFTVVPADEAETSAADADDGPPFVVAVRRQGSTGALRCTAVETGAHMQEPPECTSGISSAKRSRGSAVGRCTGSGVPGHTLSLVVFTEGPLPGEERIMRSFRAVCRRHRSPQQPEKQVGSSSRDVMDRAS